jgi:hypothetical protein
MLINADSHLLHCVHYSLPILQEITGFDEVFDDYHQYFIIFEIKILSLSCFKSDDLSRRESFAFSLSISL